jgi:aquaporin Z
MSILKRVTAELIGTFFLVFLGCGTALIESGFSSFTPSLLNIALAFGVSVIVMGYTLAPLSGAHFNPAITLAFWRSGRFPLKEMPLYWIGQCLGALLAGGFLYLIATGKAGDPPLAFSLTVNGYGEHSPGQYGLIPALSIELLLTFLLCLIALGSTDNPAAKAHAPLAIGLGLVVIHLIGIPITNLSVNPARSTGPALIAGGWAIAELWVFWFAPLAGAYLAGWAYRVLYQSVGQPAKETSNPSS